MITVQIFWLGIAGFGVVMAIIGIVGTLITKLIEFLGERSKV